MIQQLLIIKLEKTLFWIIDFFGFFANTKILLLVLFFVLAVVVVIDPLD
jgi:hypothetical protein